MFPYVFQLICSYVFYPLSFLMGVDSDDCLKMGELIGTKTFLNEFYAYTELSVYIKNRRMLNEYVQTSSCRNLIAATRYLLCFQLSAKVTSGR